MGSESAATTDGSCRQAAISWKNDRHELTSRVEGRSQSVMIVLDVGDVVVGGGNVLDG